jgi:hypothetical protein
MCRLGTANPQLALSLLNSTLWTRRFWVSTGNRLLPVKFMSSGVGHNGWVHNGTHYWWSYIKWYSLFYLTITLNMSSLNCYICRTSVTQNVEKTFQLSRQDRETIQSADYDLQVSFPLCKLCFISWNLIKFPSWHLALCVKGENVGVCEMMSRGICDFLIQLTLLI